MQVFQTLLQFRISNLYTSKRWSQKKVATLKSSKLKFVDIRAHTKSKVCVLEGRKIGKGLFKLLASSDFYKWEGRLKKFCWLLFLQNVSLVQKAYAALVENV